MTRSLAGIDRLYLDANILIYLVEGNPELDQSILAAFREVDANDISLFTSEITITECLNGAFRTGIDELAQSYLELLKTTDFITLLPVDTETCIEAARLGATHRLKTVDAIHLATATQNGCQGFLTNDSAFRATEHVEIISLTTFAPLNP